MTTGGRAARLLLLALSACMSVASLVLWIRSESRLDAWVRVQGAPDWSAQDHLQIESQAGIVGVWRQQLTADMRLLDPGPPADARWTFQTRDFNQVIPRWQLPTHPGATARHSDICGVVVVSESARSAGPAKAVRQADAAVWTFSGYRFSGVWVPYAYLVVLFSTAPAAWLLCSFWKWRGRVRAGFCARCGYDLRATPERCPECGAVTVGECKAAA